MLLSPTIYVIAFWEVKTRTPLCQEGRGAFFRSVGCLTSSSLRVISLRFPRQAKTSTQLNARFFAPKTGREGEPWQINNAFGREHLARPIPTTFTLILRTSMLTRMGTTFTPKKAVCIANKGATHVHAHLNSVEKSRKAEESDLLARYTNAYSPTGCNEKIGG